MRRKGLNLAPSHTDACLCPFYQCWTLCRLENTAGRLLLKVLRLSQGVGGRPLGDGDAQRDLGGGGCRQGPAESGRFIVNSHFKKEKTGSLATETDKPDRVNVCGLAPSSVRSFTHSPAHQLTAPRRSLNAKSCILKQIVAQKTVVSTCAPLLGYFLLLGQQNMLGQAVTHDSYLPAPECLLSPAALGGTGR